MDKSDSHFDDLTKHIDVDTHVGDVDTILKIVKAFHAKREETYQMSFAKRGQIGVFMNVARKYDRLDTLASEFFKHNISISETLVDALVDNAVYSLKWLAIINRLEVVVGEDMGFRQWLKNVFAKETGREWNQVLEAYDLDGYLVPSIAPDPQDFETEEAWMESQGKIKYGGRWIDADEYRNILQKNDGKIPS